MLIAIEGTTVASLLAAVGSILAVAVTLVRGAQSDRVNREAQAAAKSASDRAAYVDAMEVTLEAVQRDNEAYRAELRQQRLDHRAEMDALRNEYRARITELTVDVRDAAERAERAEAAARQCETERADLRRQLADARRGRR